MSQAGLEDRGEAVPLQAAAKHDDRVRGDRIFSGSALGTCRNRNSQGSPARPRKDRSANPNEAAPPGPSFWKKLARGGAWYGLFIPQA